MLRVYRPIILNLSPYDSCILLLSSTTDGIMLSLLSACLSVNKITRKVVYGYGSNFVGL